VPEKTIARLAAARGRRVWLVGGPVRDRLLGRSGGDLDLALDGAVREIGRAAARELGGSFCWHPRFLTARIEVDGRHIDVARTRRESYAAPADLPTVRPGTIEEDLSRRDFTFNAMALEVRPRKYGPLLDPFDGRTDLENGIVRILHDRSFVDDPTRAFRALRFGTRFGFRLDPATRRRLREAISEELHHRLSGERVAAELRLALSESRPAAVLTALSSSGLDSFWARKPFHPGLRYAPPRLDRLDGRPEILLGAAFWHLRLPSRRDLADRLRLTRPEKKALVDAPPRARRILGRLASAGGKVAIDRICSQASETDLTLAALIGGAAAFRLIARWWGETRELKLGIDGNDIRAAGVPSGPGIAAALARARAALVEGRATDRDSQLRAALGT